MPDWIPPSIAIRSREQARKIVEKIKEKRILTIYTDGSGILKKIGVLFVLLLENEGRYLETEKEYTIYSAELYGICETLKAVSYTIIIID